MLCIQYDEALFSKQVSKNVPVPGLRYHTVHVLIKTMMPDDVPVAFTSSTGDMLELYFTIDELCELLPQSMHTQKPIHALNVAKRDKAGLVTQVLVRSGQEHVYLDGKQLYNLCKEIKSFCYTIQKEPGTFTIHGQGYGHHLGLCQWGAREMVREGWNYRNILTFYYPGTSFKQVSCL